MNAWIPERASNTMKHRQTMDFPETRTTPPPDAGTPSLADDDTPLARILELLQGDGTGQTDAAIARLPPDHLDQLATHVHRQRQHTLDLLRCLVDCTDIILLREPPDTARDHLLRLNAHFAHLLDDCERWDDLHDNATYYRHHPNVAQRLARYWRRTWA